MKKLLFACLLFGSCISQMTQEEIEESISKSPAAQRVNKLCVEIPKPNNFRFVRKQFGGNGETTALVFYYQSNKSDREVVKFYSSWAKENGWKIIEENRYVKDNQSIVINFETFSDSNLGINCQEKH